MKKKIKYVLITILAIFLTGCSNSNVVTEINYSKLEDLINNKESFILEVIQTGCSHCEEFSPRFKAVLKTNEKEAYSINLYNMTEKELKKFNKLTTSVSGTPTVLYFEDGKETSHKINGSVPNEKIEDFLEKIKNK